MVSYEALAESERYKGQAVQRAFGDLADVGLDIADAARERREKEQAFEAKINELEFERTMNQLFRESANSVEPGAPNFAENVLSEYDARARALIQDLPENLQPAYDQRLFANRAKFEKAARDFEEQEYKRFNQNRMTDTLEGLRSRAAAFPGRMTDFQKEGESVIDSAPHLAPADADEQRRAWRRALQASVLDRLAEESPDRALDALGGPGTESLLIERLGLVDASDPNFEYGRSASRNARPFEGIVFHHTAPKPTADLIKYGQSVDAERGGAFGYHVYVDPDGTPYLGAPLDKRTNHIKPPTHGQRRGVASHLSNSNTIGISLIGASEGATPEQMATAERLAREMGAAFGIPSENIYGHGEIQGDRMESEGAFAARFREGAGGERAVALATGVDPAFADIPLEDRNKLRRKAVRERSKRERAARAASDRAKAEMRRLVDSDIESRRRTGEPVEGVSEERIARILGDDDAVRYARDAAIADGVYQFTSDVYGLTADELDARVEATKPDPGSPTFEIEAEVHDAVRKAVERQRRLRVTDPAESVLRAPSVQQAIETGNGEAAIAASLQAQESAGIAPETQQPLTNDQAESLAGGLMASIVAGTKSGEILGNGGKRIFAEKMREMRETYGEFADEVMAQVIDASVRDSDHSRAAAMIIRDIAEGNGIDLSTAAAFDETKAAGEAERAMPQGGEGGEEASAGRSVFLQGATDRAVGGAMGEMVGSMAARAEQAPQPREQFVRDVINHPRRGEFLANQMAMLRSRPALADAFDEKFGDGAAEMVLGGSGPVEFEQWLRDQVVAEE